MAERRFRHDPSRHRQPASGWRWVGLAAIVLAALASSACTSTQEFDDIRSQLQEIQFELLELRKEAPSKSDVLEAGDSVRQEIERLTVAEAATEERIRQLGERLVQLEAKLDETHFRLAQLAQQMAATNQELQAVRSAAEEAQRSPEPSPAPASADPANPQMLYDTAYGDYVSGNYDLAILGFRQYLDKASGTEQADNAAYWIGECYYRQGKYQLAIEQYDEVLTRYEHSDRTASALFKKGYAYFELGQRPQAIVQLQKVICDHPETDEAQLATQRLEELGIDVDC